MNQKHWQKNNMIKDTLLEIKYILIQTPYFIFKVCDICDMYKFNLQIM